MSKRDFTGFGFKMQFGWRLKSFLEKTRIRVNMMIVEDLETGGVNALAVMLLTQRTRDIPHLEGD